MQQEMCDAAESKKIMLFPKSRQKGMSEIAAERALFECIRNPNTQGVVISKSEEFADYFLEKRMMPKVNNLPKDLGITWPKVVDKTKDKIVFSNGSMVKSITSSSTSAASMTLDFLIIDEAGGIDENHGSFKAIFTNAYPTLDRNPKSWCMIIGTSVPGSHYNGMVWEAYTDKESEYGYYFMPWYADPTRTKDWYEAEYKKLKDEMKLQYPETMEDFFFVREGLVYKCFNAVEGGSHVNSFPINWHFPIYTAYDHGYKHPAGAIFALYDQRADHVYIFDELYYPEYHQTDVTKIALDYKKKIEMFPKQPVKQIADTAIFAQRDGVITTETVFRRHGIRFTKSRKYDEKGSRDLLIDRFVNNKITIHPRCINLINELMTQRWSQSKKGETPEDINNDLLDATRYMMAEIRASYSSKIEQGRSDGLPNASMYNRAGFGKDNRIFSTNNYKNVNNNSFLGKNWLGC